MELIEAGTGLASGLYASHEADVANDKAASETKKKLEGYGYTTMPPERATPEYLGQFVKDEIAKWAVPIKASGVKIE